jgi:predicted nuclease of predicted toxin-antitoxin system
VKWIAEQAPGVTDQDVLRIAQEDQRVLLTFDRDFGEAVFRCGESIPGIVLLRLRAANSAELSECFQRAWERITDRVRGQFVVINNNQVRLRRLALNQPSNKSD